jgi:hypothetical protein
MLGGSGGGGTATATASAYDEEPLIASCGRRIDEESRQLKARLKEARKSSNSDGATDTAEEVCAMLRHAAQIQVEFQRRCIAALWGLAPRFCDRPRDASSVLRSGVLLRAIETLMAAALDSGSGNPPSQQLRLRASAALGLGCECVVALVGGVGDRCGRIADGTVDSSSSCGDLIWAPEDRAVALLLCGDRGNRGSQGDAAAPPAVELWLHKLVRLYLQVHTDNEESFKKKKQQLVPLLPTILSAAEVRPTPWLPLKQPNAPFATKSTHTRTWR